MHTANFSPHEAIFQVICSIYDLSSFYVGPVLDTAVRILATVCCCVSHIAGLSEAGGGDARCTQPCVLAALPNNMLHKDGTLCFNTD